MPAHGDQFVFLSFFLINKIMCNLLNDLYCVNHCYCYNYAILKYCSKNREKEICTTTTKKQDQTANNYKEAWNKVIFKIISNVKTRMLGVGLPLTSTFQIYY